MDLIFFHIFVLFQDVDHYLHREIFLWKSLFNRWKVARHKETVGGCKMSTIPRWETDPSCKKCEIRLTKFGDAMSVQQLQFIKERAHIVACLKKDRKDVESFSKFLFDKTDIGVNIRTTTGSADAATMYVEYVLTALIGKE